MYYLLTENMYSTISGAKDFLLHMVMFSGCSGGDPLLLGSTEFLLAESGLICVGLETFSAAVAYPRISPMVCSTFAGIKATFK